MKTTCLLTILILTILIAGCTGCESYQLDQRLANQNSSESIYLSDADHSYSGTFYVDTSYSTNGSVFFGSSEKIIRGTYIWYNPESDTDSNLTLTADNGNRYVFSLNGDDYILVLGFENSTGTVTQFKYSYLASKC